MFPRYCINKDGTDGQTDGQPENAMPLVTAVTSVEALKGGGYVWLVLYCFVCETSQPLPEKVRSNKSEINFGLTL